MRDNSNRPRRGLRYPLHLPVRFRAAGDFKWRLGTTEDVSRSGVMIRADAVPDADVPIDVLIELPQSAAGSGGCLRGRGRVVRLHRAQSSPEQGVFAVAVARYRLEPVPSGDISMECQTE